MRSWLRLFVLVTAAGCVATGCLSPDDGPDDTGGAGSSGSGATTGAAGTSPAAGTTGAAGTSAAAGTFGSAGTNGGAGTTATAGTTGAAGTSPAAGTTGSAGTSAAGTSGSAGTFGSAGTNGRGGTTGGAGRGGAGGGSAGTGSGPGGTTGAAGSTGGFNPCPGSPCRILPVGDSITFGIQQEGAWRIELFRKTLMAMQKITYTGTLQNGPQTVDGVAFPRRYEATSGITIDGISQQITRNNTLNMPSDIVMVHIGTNDMYMANPGGAPMRLGTLIDKLVAGYPNALIVVAKIIPLPSGTSAVNTFNAAIPGIVKTRADAGKHVIVVDLNTGFPSSGLSSDNVHPNASGYAWMGGKFYDAVSAVLPK